MNEQALLEAIGASPRDAALRLVYADWLEERGDGRGELVRVEEEMRALPAYSDRFWQLKARRNELRAAAAPGWLEAMGYGSDVWPLFGHGVPDGWRERWRLVRELVERWHRRPMPDVGGRAAEVREVEERLGRALPPSLREYVAFAHDLGTGYEHPIVLRGFYQMQELSGHEVVSLLLSGESDYRWIVRYEDFGVPDPPVHGFNEEEDAFVLDGDNPVIQSVTSFALSYALTCTDRGGGGLVTHVHDPTRLLHDLAEAFPAGVRLGAVLLCEADNILVRLLPSASQQAVYLEVKLAMRLPREAVPAFLCDYAVPRSSGNDAIPF
jgi:uncharacterized protein (TIGR02996 family)